MLVEMAGFEPSILWILIYAASLQTTKAAQQTFLLELNLNCASLVL
jgi:hypothetical protein